MVMTQEEAERLHVSGICLSCRDGVHVCDYGDERIGSCWKRGSRVVVVDGVVFHYCRSHAAWAVFLCGDC